MRWRTCLEGGRTYESPRPCTQMIVAVCFFTAGITIARGAAMVGRMLFVELLC